MTAAEVVAMADFVERERAAEEIEAPLSEWEAAVRRTFAAPAELAPAGVAHSSGNTSASSGVTAQPIKLGSLCAQQEPKITWNVFLKS